MCGTEGESGEEMVDLRWNFTHASYFVTLWLSGSHTFFWHKEKGVEGSDGFHQLAGLRAELQVWHHERNCICFPLPQSNTVLCIREGAVETFYIHQVN